MKPIIHILRVWHKICYHQNLVSGGTENSLGSNSINVKKHKRRGVEISYIRKIKFRYLELKEANTPRIVYANYTIYANQFCN